ncbi:MAG TPA: glucokinase [Vicinamibacterales bacterium]|nr:glucokinase [Vicinamibacterales bacterium]
MLLAADVGGTKTLLGLFNRAPERPVAVEVGEFTTLEYEGLTPMIREFLKAHAVDPRRIDAATFGVAGAVTEQVARLTNVPWLVDAAAIADTAALKRVHLLNDLEAMAYSVPVLEPDELATLQQGIAQPTGNAAVIAAGTGLGEALLHNIDGRFIPGASEGGHADWAARTPREIEMLVALTRVYDRVDVEHVVSGPGLVNIYQFTHDAFGSRPFLPSAVAPARLCPGVGPLADPADLPAAISKSALEKRCPMCVEALELFVSAYGAEAGNLALRTVATAGIYIGGGIAPKILPALETGAFVEAFRAKEPLADFVATVPIAVILNAEAGLLGAAVHANDAASRAL